ncbi:MAG: diguanylate cyclase [Candidatus Omnitrophica bacterium]|nr:diguanylate cyclase [Candidatus Omnitrophota bacterium]
MIRQITLAESIVDAVKDPLLVLDEGLHVVMANRSFYKLFKVSPSNTSGELLFDLGNGQWNVPHLRKLLEEILPQQSEFHDFEVRHVFETLGLRTMLLNARRIPGEEPLILLAMEDITERRDIENKLAKASEKRYELSLTDVLTRLYNRRGFLELAQHQLNVAKRLKQNLFLLFMDLNGLKQINDRLGHGEGDSAILNLSVILKNTFRQSDILARFGGDEFIGLGLESRPGTTRKLTDRIHQKLSAWRTQTTPPYRLSVSVGAAHYRPASPFSLTELVAQADRRMYSDKIRGKIDPFAGRCFCLLP